MKLAEALQERADLNRKIEELHNRLQNNCLVQEGETPAEDPEALLGELNEAVSRLGTLIAAINLTNSSTRIDGKTLTERIAEKDALSLQLSIYRDIVGEASRTAQRATRSEIRILSALDVRALQKKADELAHRLRLADNALQEQNWKTELL